MSLRAAVAVVVLALVAVVGPATAGIGPVAAAAAPRLEPDVIGSPQGLEVFHELLADDDPDDPDWPLDPESTRLRDGDEWVRGLVQPGVGQFDLDGSNSRFVPDPAFVGAAEVTFRVAGASGAPAATSTLTINVSRVTVADESTGAVGTTQLIDVLANDVTTGLRLRLDPDSLALVDDAGVERPVVTVAGGSYAVVDATVVFTPAAGFVGDADPVGYRVRGTDGFANAVLGSTVRAIVEGVPPALTPDAVTITQGDVALVDVLANDTAGDPDAELDPSTLAVVGDRPVRVEDGTLRYDSADVARGRYLQPDPFTYRVADTLGTSGRSTLTVTVRRVTVDDTSEGAVGEVQTVRPLANDDPDALAGLQPATLRLWDEQTGRTGDRIFVADGVYTLDEDTITYTPTTGRTRAAGTPQEVGYQVERADGVVLRASWSPRVGGDQPGTGLVSTGRQGARQEVDVAAALPDEDPTVLTLYDGAESVDELLAPGEGTFVVEGGSLRFQPLPGFVGRATDVGYGFGDQSDPAVVTGRYRPVVTRVTAVDLAVGDVGSPVLGFDPLSNDTVDPDVVMVPGSLELVADGRSTDVVTRDGEARFALRKGAVDITPVGDYVGTTGPVTYRAAYRVRGNPDPVTVESTLVARFRAPAPVTHPGSTPPVTTPPSAPEPDAGTPGTAPAAGPTQLAETGTGAALPGLLGLALLTIMVGGRLLRGRRALIRHGVRWCREYAAQPHTML